MKKKNLHLISAITIGTAIIAATSYCVWKMNKDIDNTNIVGLNIKASDWRTYKNEEFGFELQYPKAYESDDAYVIVETTPEEYAMYGQYQYRIVTVRNVHGETIFSIEVFPKSKKEEVLKNIGCEEEDSCKFSLTGEKVLIGNNIEAEKVDSYERRLFIERDEFIYFITSFVSPEMAKTYPDYKLQYDEYQNILKTLKIN